MILAQNDHLGKEVMNIDMERDKLQDEVKQVMAALEQVMRTGYRELGRSSIPKFRLQKQNVCLMFVGGATLQPHWWLRVPSVEPSDVALLFSTDNKRQWLKIYIDKVLSKVH